MYFNIMEFYINLIKNIKLSQLNGIYEHYYLCFGDDYKKLKQPLNELNFIGYFDVNRYKYNNSKIVYDKLLEYKNDESYNSNNFIYNVDLTDDNIILLTCKKINPYNKNENHLTILTQIISPLICKGMKINFISHKNEQP